MKKFFKGLKKVVGFAAMVAAPFLAAPIAGAIGISGTLATAAVGAGVGALGAGLAGVDPLIGAGIGGLGAFGMGGGFAGGAAGAAGGGAAGGGGLFGGLFTGPAPGSTASILGTQAAPAAAGLTTGAAAGGAAAGGGFFSGLTLGNLAPLAFAMFGKAPQDLTAEEQALLQRNAETAATERGVFNQQLAGARSLLQQGEANPERAFAEGQMAAQRGLRESERTAALAGRGGLQDAERRRAAIEGARVGTAAVTGEQARAAQATSAGLSALPRNVPTSAEELDMAVYRDLYQRRSDYATDLANAAGQFTGSLS
jgi:hypothetical protein